MCFDIVFLLSYLFIKGCIIHLDYHYTCRLSYYKLLERRFFRETLFILKNKREKSKPYKDTPIKLTDITGYSLNNPFPSFDDWCKSSNNLTLYLLNGKHRTFSVKEQSMLVDWLKENNISCISKKSIGNIIEHIIYTAANLFFIVFYSYQIKAKDTDLGIIFLIISVVCIAYWIVYIISGLYIKKKNSKVSF